MNKPSWLLALQRSSLFLNLYHNISSYDTFKNTYMKFPTDDLWTEVAVAVAPAVEQRVNLGFDGLIPSCMSNCPPVRY